MFILNVIKTMRYIKKLGFNRLPYQKLGNSILQRNKMWRSLSNIGIMYMQYHLLIV